MACQCSLDGQRSQRRSPYVQAVGLEHSQRAQLHARDVHQTELHRTEVIPELQRLELAGAHLVGHRHRRDDGGGSAHADHAFDELHLVGLGRDGWITGVAKQYVRLRAATAAWMEANEWPLHHLGDKDRSAAGQRMGRADDQRVFGLAALYVKMAREVGIERQ